MTENRLPHWQQEGATYFVTFRLADSIPKVLLDQWAEERERWLRLHPYPHAPEVEMEYHVRFAGALERCLDEGVSTRATERVFFANPRWQRWWAARCSTSKVSVVTNCHGS